MEENKKIVATQILVEWSDSPALVVLLANMPSQLQADFDKMNSQINKVTNDLAQMKANLNALNGAIQQVNKLIEMVPQTKETTKK